MKVLPLASRQKSKKARVVIERVGTTWLRIFTHSCTIFRDIIFFLFVYTSVSFIRFFFRVLNNSTTGFLSRTRCLGLLVFIQSLSLFGSLFFRFASLRTLSSLRKVGGQKKRRKRNENGRNFKISTDDDIIIFFIKSSHLGSNFSS